MIPLSQVNIGRFKIVAVLTPGVFHRLRNMGIFVGDIIEVVKPAPGPVIFKKGNIRVGIGTGMAFRIMVIPVKEK